MDPTHIAVALIYGAFSRSGATYLRFGLGLRGTVYLVLRTSFERVQTKSREVENLNRLYLAVAEALATAIDAKDQTTHCHVRRVQVYAAAMGKMLGLSETEIAALRAGALAVARRGRGTRRARARGDAVSTRSHPPAHG